MVHCGHEATKHRTIHANRVSVNVFLNFLVTLLLTYLMLGLTHLWALRRESDYMLLCRPLRLYLHVSLFFEARCCGIYLGLFDDFINDFCERLATPWTLFARDSRHFLADLCLSRRD